MRKLKGQPITESRVLFRTTKNAVFVFQFLFLGAINAGLGAAGMNAFLTSLNIPWINKNGYKKREDEAGKGIAKVSSDSCREAVKEEVCTKY
jgi:hypothetical protein